MQTFEQYLLENYRRCTTDHTIVANESCDGEISFYVHASHKESATLDFAVLGNKLLPLQPEISGQVNKTAAQAIEEAGTAQAHNTASPKLPPFEDVEKRINDLFIPCSKEAKGAIINGARICYEYIWRKLRA